MEKRRAMVRETLDVVEVEDDGNGDGDEVQFISQIEAAEAQALSIKRRRVTTLSTAASSTASPVYDFFVKGQKPDVLRSEVEEGAYIAALKGSKGQLWQKNALSASYLPGGGGGGSSYVGGGGGGGAGDACFKCGKVGHWARDCDADSYGRSVIIDAPAEKACPCGVGMCSVLTANTERNSGRKFYKCPVREENGGCGFFEWCDKPSAANDFAEERGRYNAGQQFHRHQKQGSSGFPQSIDGGASSDWMNGSNAKSSSLRTGSMCFKCNKEGHWARDCPIASSSSITSTRGNPSSSGSCYKCGQPGHWARDCPPSQAVQVKKR